MAPDDKPARTANIFDVARLAGVSHQTVSRVLNNVPNVRPATRERVEQAIRQLRYTPSPAARALVTKRTRAVGLITPGNADYGPSSIALHFSLAARNARYHVDSVSALDTDPSGVRSIVESLLRQRVDAVVVIVGDQAVLDAVRGIELGAPLIAVAASARPQPLTVSIDQYRGARAAVRHLVERGHTRIVHVAGPLSSPDAAERLRGWRDELAASGLVASEPLLGDWSPASGSLIGSTLDVEPGMAIFSGNDQMALGLMSALLGRGFRIPDDVSIVGYDDIPEAEYFTPPLTTVRQDFASLGSIIMQQVLLAIEEPDSIAEATPLPTTLVVRQSTARPD